MFPAPAWRRFVAVAYRHSPHDSPSDRMVSPPLPLPAHRALSVSRAAARLTLTEPEAWGAIANASLPPPLVLSGHAAFLTPY